MTTMAETARPLATTMTCSRCRSENFGDLKFCRFCGCRLRVPPPVESFVRPGEAARPTPSPFIPVDVELAKRYVAQGKHHFAVGDLDRAGECFRRALDAAPGHPQLVGFLRRVGELKARLAQSQAGDLSQAGAQSQAGASTDVANTRTMSAPGSARSSGAANFCTVSAVGPVRSSDALSGSSRPSLAPSAPPVLRVLPSPDPVRGRRPVADVAATGPGARVISLRRPPALSVVPAPATVTDGATSADAARSAEIGAAPGAVTGLVASAMAGVATSAGAALGAVTSAVAGAVSSAVAGAAPASESRVRVVAAAGSLRADPAAEIPSAAPGRTSSALSERRTGARVLVADRPLSPALLMDRASGLEAWNETVAGVMVVAGLLAFGWILMFW